MFSSLVCYIKRKNSEILSKCRNSESAEGSAPAQVLVRWSLQQGVVTIPKSVKKERVEENWKVWDFQLSEEQMKALGGLHRGTRVTWDPDQVP